MGVRKEDSERAMMCEHDGEKRRKEGPRASLYREFLVLDHPNLVLPDMEILCVSFNFQDQMLPKAPVPGHARPFFRLYSAALTTYCSTLLALATDITGLQS